MPKSLEDKIFDYRTAHDMAKYARGGYSRSTSYAKQIELAGLRDAYDNAVAAKKAGLLKRAASSALDAEKEMWDMALDLTKGYDSVKKTQITSAATQANKTLEAMEQFIPSTVSVAASSKILHAATQGWIDTPSSPELHSEIKKVMMSGAKPLSSADWNATLAEITFGLSISPEDLRREMSEIGGNETFLAKWDENESLDRATYKQVELSDIYDQHRKKASGAGGSVKQLISNFKELKAAHGRDDQTAVDESYESISTIPTGEIETRRRILDEQSPATHQRAIFADKGFRDKMADYGYTDPGEFFVDYVRNKGRTLDQSRSPVPRTGAALVDGGMGVGSPDEVRAIEQGIRDEDLAADLEKADIGRSQARTAEQVDAEKEWLAEYEKADAEEPPESLSDREWYQWHVDKLLPLQNKLQRTIDPGSDFRKEWDEKLEAHLELAEVGVKESLEIEDEPFAEQGGQFMHEGQPIPIIAESDSARRRATAGALRGEAPAGMSRKEVAEALTGLRGDKEAAEAAQVAEEQAVAPPIPAPGIGTPAEPVQAPEAETTIEPGYVDQSAERERLVGAYPEASIEDQGLERKRLVEGLARGLTPQQMALMAELKKSKDDEKAATTAWGRILQNVGE